MKVPELPGPGCEALKSLLWWRRAVLPSHPWGVCFLSFFHVRLMTTALQVLQVPALVNKHRRKFCLGPLLHLSPATAAMLLRTFNVVLIAILSMSWSRCCLVWHSYSRAIYPNAAKGYPKKEGKKTDNKGGMGGRHAATTHVLLRRALSRPSFAVRPLPRRFIAPFCAFGFLAGSIRRRSEARP